MTADTLPPLPEPAKYLRQPSHVLLPWDVANAQPPQESSAGWAPYFTADQLRQAVLEERERCAKVCEDKALELEWSGYWKAVSDLCATSIRSGA
jgi:hypothetical protein